MMEQFRQTASELAPVEPGYDLRIGDGPAFPGFPLPITLPDGAEYAGVVLRINDAPGASPEQEIGQRPFRREGQDGTPRAHIFIGLARNLDDVPLSQQQEQIGLPYAADCFLATARAENVDAFTKPEIDSHLPHRASFAGFTPSDQIDPDLFTLDLARVNQCPQGAE